MFFESGQPKLAFGKQVLKRPDKITSLPERQTTTLQQLNVSILGIKMADCMIELVLSGN